MTRTARRSFAWNAAALSAAQLATPVLNAATIVLLAHWGSPEILGRYSVLVTAFVVIDQVRLLGLHRFLTRELAAGRPDASVQYRAFVRVTDAGALAGAVLLLVYGIAMGAPVPAVAALGIGLWPSGRVATNDAVFLALGRADFTTRVVAIEGVLRATASIATLYFIGADLTLLSVIYLAGRIVAAVVGHAYRTRLFPSAPEASDAKAVYALLAHVPAFFSVTSLPLLLLRADLLVIGSFATARDVGFYGAAARLVTVLIALPDGIMLANFARLAQTKDPEGLRRAVRQCAVAILLFVVLPTALVAAWATPLVTLVYGQSYADAARYLSYLIWSLPLFLLARTVGDALVAAGQQQRLAVVIIGTVAIAAPIYAVLAPAFGARGVALAYLGSLVTLLVLSLIAARTLLATSRGFGQHGEAHAPVESR